MNSSSRIALYGCALTMIASTMLTTDAQAGITGINTPVTSTVSILFDDTNSSAPPFGTTNTGPLVSPWNGTTVTLPLTTDPITLDYATGSIDATFVVNTNTYAINFNNITLAQVGANTGFAHLNFTFNVEYQLDALGLPIQPTIYPNFVVNGTVQNTSGSFAALGGFINYSGVNTAGTYSVLETVNYSALWTTPGAFTATVFGVPVNGTTPLLVGNTTLTVDGFFSFQVDPATINAYSVQSNIPEPVSLVLFGGLMAGMTLRRRSNRRD